MKINLSLPQKTLLVITSITLGLIIILAGFIAWQKNELLTKQKQQKAPTSITETKKENETKVQETKKQLTAKQQIVKEILPNSDLTEFDIPKEYIDEEHLQAIAINRSGEITALNPEQQEVTILSILFDKEKEYKVKIDSNTTIIISVTEYKYKNVNDPEEIPSETSYVKNGSFSDLKIGDILYIETRRPINNAEFVAKKIQLTKIYTINN